MARKVFAKVVNKRDYAFDVYIGRGSKWGNPFSHLESSNKAKYKVKTRKAAIIAYKEYILYGEGKHLLNDLHELKSQTLGCYCKPKACHGDVLIELVNNL